MIKLECNTIIFFLLCLVTCACTERSVIKGERETKNIRIVRQSTIPIDTTIKWIDAGNTSVVGIENVYEFQKGSWTQTEWYSSVGKVYSNQRPLYVLSSGQSNATPRAEGGELHR